MPLVLSDRVQETATANTTVSFTLAGPVSGFQSFAAGVGDGNTTYYSATDAAGNWEVGLGAFSVSGALLTRTTVYKSSNAGSAVTFAGTVNVFVTYPADRSVNLDSAGNVSPLGVVSSGTWQGSTVASDHGGTGLTTFTGANNALYSTGASTLTAGTLPIAAGGTGQTTQQAALNALSGTQTANRVLRSNGTNVTLSQVALGTDVSGTLSIANGGTGQTTQQAALNALSGTQTANRVLRSNGTNVTLSQVALGTDVSGTLATGNGGTGQTTYSAGQLLIGNVSGGLSRSTLTAGSGVSITNGNGSITISAAGVSAAMPLNAGIVFGFTSGAYYAASGYAALNTAALNPVVWPGEPDFNRAVYSTAVGGGALENATGVPLIIGPYIADPGFGFVDGSYSGVAITLGNGAGDFLEVAVNIEIMAGSIASFDFTTGVPVSYGPGFSPYRATVMSTEFVALLNEFDPYPWVAPGCFGQVSGFFTYQNSFYNTAVGKTALYGLAQNSPYNTAVGANAGAGLTTNAYGNTFIGSDSGANLSSGYYNTYIGRASGNDYNTYNFSGENGYVVLSDGGGSLRAVFNDTGLGFYRLSNPATRSGAGTLSGSDLATQIVVASGTSYSLQLPTAANLLSAIGTAGNFGSVAIDTAFEFSVINTASGTVTITTNTGMTLVGNGAITTGTSATFKVRRTGDVYSTVTFVVYRV